MNKFSGRQTFFGRNFSCHPFPNCELETGTQNVAHTHTHMSVHTLNPGSKCHMHSFVTKRQNLYAFFSCNFSFHIFPSSSGRFMQKIVDHCCPTIALKVKSNYSIFWMWFSESRKKCKEANDIFRYFAKRGKNKWFNAIASEVYRYSNLTSVHATPCHAMSYHVKSCSCHGLKFVVCCWLKGSHLHRE